MACLLHLLLPLLGLSVSDDTTPSTGLPTRVGPSDNCTIHIVGNGFMNCTGNDRRNVCDIECAGNYEGTFVCTPEEGWNSQLPKCVRKENNVGASGHCTIHIEGNGSMNCTGNDRRNVCDIECAANNEGTFVCTPEEGWNSQLPKCVRKENNDEGTINQAGGCTADRCVPYCRGYGKSGFCREAYPGGEKMCSCEE